MSPDGPDGGPSVRERRAERARKGAPIDATRRVGRPLAILAVLLLLGVGVWAAATYIDKAPTRQRAETIHRHAAIKVYVDDREVDFHKCEFDLDGCNLKDGTHYVAGHLHYHEDIRYMVHIEHPTSIGNLTVKRFFERGLKFGLTNESLTFDTRVHDGRTVANNATHTWQLWIQHCFLTTLRWERVTGITDYIPLQHDRMLLTYTDRNETELRDQMESVPVSADMLRNGGGACPILVTRTPTSSSSTATST